LFLLAKTCSYVVSERDATRAKIQLQSLEWYLAAKH
jgi:hypothetical protein